MESKTSPTLNIGLIGFGFIGRLHAQAYQSIPYAFPKPVLNAHLRAVLREHPARDDEFIRSLNLSKVTANQEEFYSQPLDAVDVCSPNVHHREQVLEAIRQKKHVYCE